MKTKIKYSDVPLEFRLEHLLETEELLDAQTEIFKIEDVKNFSCESPLSPFATFILFWVMNTETSVKILRSFIKIDTYYIMTSTRKDYETLKDWLGKYAEVVE